MGEIQHKDGDPTNNALDNLIVVDTIEVGDRVSWKSNIAPYTRYFGVVVPPPEIAKGEHYSGEHYYVRTNKRVIIPIHQSRITKECG